MDRLKLWIAPAFAAVAFIVVVALSPASRWTVRDSENILVGRWSIHSGYGEFGSPPLTLGPTTIAEPFGDDDDAAFLSLMAIPPEYQPGDFEKRMDRLFDYCETKNSAIYWAQFVRRACDVARVEDDPTKNGSSLVPRKTLCLLLIEGCERGAKLDPNNAFFPLVETAGLCRIGQRERAEKLLIYASRLTRFEEYVPFEENLRYAYLTRREGYPGNAARTRILTSVRLPQFSVIKAALNALAKDGPVADRVAAARVGGLLIRQSSSFIGILIGKSIVEMAFGLEPHGREGIPATHEEFMNRARTLRALAPGATDLDGIADVAGRADPSPNLLSEEDISSIMYSLAPLVSAWMLALCLFAPLALVVAWSGRRFPTFAAVTPYFFLLLLFAERGERSGVIAPLIAGFSFLLLVPALFSKTRPYADMAGVAAAIVAILFSLNGSWVLAAEILFLAALYVRRRVSQLSLAWSTAVFVVGCFLSAGVWAYVAVAWPSAIGGNGVICTTACLLGVPYGAKLRPAQWLGATGVLVVAGFAASTAKCLANDKALGLVNQQFMHEGDAIRSESGISGA